MSVLVTIGALVLLALWTMSVYNRLVRLRNRVTGGWRQVDLELKRRHDLVPRLVDSVRESVQFEGDTLDAVLAARTRAVGARGPADAGRKESELTTALRGWFTLDTRNPQLSANAQLRSLHEELAASENRIASAEQLYNDIAAKYNAAIDAIPGNLVAGFAGFKSAELFELISPSERAVPSVDLPRREADD